MSRFIDKLNVSLLDDSANDFRGAWKLNDDFRYFSESLGRIVSVPAGFITDFESCPRIPIAFWICGNLSREAAVVHDYLYRVHKFTRKQSDKVLKEAAIVTGVPKWRSWLLYLGVRIGGQPSWIEASKKNVIG